MKRTTPDQDLTFQGDHFLCKLSHLTEAKFALIEHAPHNERKSKFIGLIAQNKLPLTFTRTGVNIPLQLEWKQDDGKDIAFRSAPLIYNGVWIKVEGTFSKETLEGNVKCSKIDPPQEEQESLTEEQLNVLREKGLPI